MNKLAHYIKEQKSRKELFRYILVGCVSNLSGYTLYLLLTYFGANPKITMTFLYGAAALIGFLGNRTLTFSYKGSTLQAGTRYIIAHCFGYLLNLSILIFASKSGYPHQYAQAVAVVIVAIFLFITFKLFVFRRPYSLPMEHS